MIRTFRHFVIVWFSYVLFCHMLCFLYSDKKFVIFCTLPFCHFMSPCHSVKFSFCVVKYSLNLVIFWLIVCVCWNNLCFFRRWQSPSTKRMSSHPITPRYGGATTTSGPCGGASAAATRWPSCPTARATPARWDTLLCVCVCLCFACFAFFAFTEKGGMQQRRFVVFPTSSNYDNCTCALKKSKIMQKEMPQ